MSKKAFGIEIGGSGIKGAPVDTATGRLTAERLRRDRRPALGGFVRKLMEDAA